MASGWTPGALRSEKRSSERILTLADAKWRRALSGLIALQRARWPQGLSAIERSTLRMPRRTQLAPPSDTTTIEVEKILASGDALIRRRLAA